VTVTIDRPARVLRDDTSRTRPMTVATSPARSEPIVATLDAVATRALGRRPARRGEPFWTDCAILKDAGIPCVMFGADGAGAHAKTEWTTLSSVRTLADILTDTAIAFCR
jgi:acetylornithine deacetylase